MGAGERFAGAGIALGPDLAAGDAFFADLDEDGVAWDLIGIKGRRRGEMLVAGEEEVLGEAFAIDRDLIEGALELIAGGSAIAAADHDVIGIGDGRPGGLAAHVPGALRDAGAIDVGDDGVGLAKGVGEGEMVPVAIGVESFGSGPAMVFRILAGGAEEESGERVSFVALKAEGPVLVFGSEGLVPVPALANEVGEGIRGDGIEGNPSFDGDGVIVGEAKRRGVR